MTEIVAMERSGGKESASRENLEVNSFPLEDYTWWVSTGHGDGNNRQKKHCNEWCAVCGGKYEWRHWLYRWVSTPMMQNVFKAHGGATRVL